MNIRWVSPFKDSSGYGQFARSWIVALHRAGVKVHPHEISFESIHADHGEYGKICNKLAGGTEKCDINIVNTIPKFFKSHRLEGALNIGFTMFEADRIPESWVQQCNEMDAILVPSFWCADVFVNSGVRVPVLTTAPGVDPELYPLLPSKTTGPFKFYSIFQWSERKNPTALIRAFIHAFSGTTDVSLTIKSYFNDYSKEDFALVRDQINTIKQSVETSHIPAIYLKHANLTDKEMAEFHQSNDCFVLPTRAEGYGLPFIEAMMYGRPTIGTNYSGQRDFMDLGGAYLIPCSTEPVFNMHHRGGWYTANMKWAQPSIGDTARLMREVYDNRAKAQVQAQQMRQVLTKHLSWHNQIRVFTEALSEIKKAV